MYQVRLNIYWQAFNELLFILLKVFITLLGACWYFLMILQLLLHL